jgi:hypothetical protein
MVGFSAADMHRVNVPWKHERCAVVLSLTKDESLKNSGKNNDNNKLGEKTLKTSQKLIFIPTPNPT